MNQPKTSKMPLQRCPVCGGELSPGIPPARCPHCLLRQGLANSAADPQNDTVLLSEAASRRVLPQPGETFGHYRIGRVLGEGGMGTVFEAEDLENGRRVALKVLGHRLDSPEARSRFFREGRLAASVNHPNSVYVFGTEDIAGAPVIAMELVAGGTLQDRVLRQGPMPVGEAVDSALQIIAGLEAAQQVGVLHRDVKPSNCFVEADGSVKIGDFGLSISTVVRSEPALTATGAFLGTPAFASPEQLRGDEMTVRSDIYAVGVTLYYLLTGHYPFNAPDMVRLLATVLERKAEPLTRWRPELPAELCRLVLRCLEKDPENRFRNYAELRQSLLPYAPEAPKPAAPGLRLAAYVLDVVFLALLGTLVNILINFVAGSAQPGHVTPAEAILTQLTVYEPSVLLMHNVCGMVLALIYYTWLEGTWGASLGKQLCGLRVARLDQSVAGWHRALVRALVINGTPTVLWLLGWSAARAWTSGNSFEHWVTLLGFIILPTRLAMFVTARLRNGYAGMHDLISATRVVMKLAYHPRPALLADSQVPPEIQTLPLIGPYHVLDRLGGKNGAEMLLGFDARLLRHVWIRRQLLGAPAVPACLRQLSRPGRLRWLTGQRTDTDSWDAYEAASGEPLLKLIAHPQEWGRIRYWLLDLAEELLAATREGTVPKMLSLDQVWITADGRAKLLDFVTPQTDKLSSEKCPGTQTAAATPQLFLKLVAASALQGRATDSAGSELLLPVSPPLHALRFLDTLTPYTDLNQCAARLRTLLPLPVRISRSTRALLLAGALAFPILVAGLAWGISAFKRNILIATPELATLSECLTHYDQLQREKEPQKLAHSQDIQAFETYIACRFGPQITNAAQWNNAITRAVIAPQLRLEAERILNRRASPGEAEVAAATVRLEQFFKKSPELAALEALQRPNLFLGALGVGYIVAVVCVIVPCLAASLLFRGGAMAGLLGIVFVNRKGQPVSRWRLAARNLIAWLPFLLIPASVWILETLPLMAGLVAILLAGVSLLLPVRGLQDRLAGTWPVPR